MKVKMIIVLIGFCQIVCSIANAQNWERRDVGFFDELKISGNLDVELILSDTYYLEIENKSCCLKDVNIEERGDFLRINYDKGLVLDDQVRIKVYTTEIRSISILAGAQIKNQEPLTSRSIELLAWSGASCELSINSEFLNLRAHSGAEVNISGSVNKLSLKAHSGAMLELEDLETIDADVNVATGAQVNLGSLESLEAKATTGGIINFDGDPTHLNITQNLGGSICKGSTQQMN